jgi:hypothetical protein
MNYLLALFFVCYGCCYWFGSLYLQEWQQSSAARYIYELFAVCGK